MRTAESTKRWGVCQPRGPGIRGRTPRWTEGAEPWSRRRPSSSRCRHFLRSREARLRPAAGPGRGSVQSPKAAPGRRRRVAPTPSRTAVEGPPGPCRRPLRRPLSPFRKPRRRRQDSSSRPTMGTIGSRPRTHRGDRTGRDPLAAKDLLEYPAGCRLGRSPWANVLAVRARLDGGGRQLLGVHQWRSLVKGKRKKAKPETHVPPSPFSLFPFPFFLFPFSFFLFPSLRASSNQYVLQDPSGVVPRVLSLDKLPRFLAGLAEVAPVERLQRTCQVFGG